MVREEWAAELSRTAELFRTTVENLPINLVLYDRGYRILYMNPMLANTCAKLCGRTPEELVGMSGPELWPAPIWGPLHEHTQRAIATRERQTYELATNLPGRGRSVREWTVVPLVGANGEVDRIIAMTIDVTAQHIMVEELRAADQRKSEFIAVLSHELRNPLAAIRLSLHVLEEGVPGSEEAAGLFTWWTICWTSPASGRTRSSFSGTGWTSTTWCAAPSRTTGATWNAGAFASRRGLRARRSTSTPTACASPRS